jgi:hypothetical protein
MPRCRWIFALSAALLGCPKESDQPQAPLVAQAAKPPQAPPTQEVKPPAAVAAPDEKLIQALKFEDANGQNAVLFWKASSSAKNPDADGQVFTERLRVEHVAEKAGNAVKVWERIVEAR